MSGELGLRRFVGERGHRLIVTSDKEGDDYLIVEGGKLAGSGAHSYSAKR